MKTETLRRTTTWMSIVSILPHIFCCGIPAVMALISLGTTVGLAGILATNPFYKFVDNYHEILIAIAITSVFLSGTLNFIAYRIDCHTATAQGCDCDHNHCAPKKKSSARIFLFSLGLLALDLAWFATEKFALGLHQ